MFVRQRAGPADICVVGRDGRDERVVAAAPQDELDGAHPRRVGPAGWSVQTPAWSPDGRRFAGSRPGGAGAAAIWLVPLDGAAPTPLVEGDEGTVDPAWSPHGARLAYATGCGLVVLDVESKQATSVASTDRRDRRPSWSRDGRSLVVESGRDGNAEIYLVPVR